MLVYLKADVAKVGKKGEVVEVPDGYAKNVLIPKNLARPVTPQEAQQLKTSRQLAQAAHQQHLQNVTERLAQCAREKAPLVVRSRANEAGRLYTALREDDIAQAFAHLCGVSLPKECRIVLPRPLKEVGEYEVTVDIGGKQRVGFPLRVEPTK